MYADKEKRLWKRALNYWDSLTLNLRLIIIQNTICILLFFGVNIFWSRLLLLVMNSASMYFWGKMPDINLEQK